MRFLVQVSTDFKFSPSLPHELGDAEAVFPLQLGHEAAAAVLGLSLGLDPGLRMRREHDLLEPELLGLAHVYELVLVPAVLGDVLGAPEGQLGGAGGLVRGGAQPLCYLQQLLWLDV